MNHDGPQESLGLNVVKVLGALALLALTLVFGWPRLAAYLARDTVVDQGPRGLVVVATRGGAANLTLHVRIDVDRDGAATMVLYVTEEDVTYGEAGTTTSVSYSVSFAGESLDSGVTCGTSQDPIARQVFTNLAVGAQKAIEIDALGGPASALNYNGDVSTAEMAGRVFPEFRGTLWTLDDADGYAERTPIEGSTDTWAESCSLPYAALWRDESTGGRATGRRTLLPPQVDWTSLDSTTDHQAKLDVRIHVDRAHGIELAEAYPAPDVQDDSWLYKSSVTWVGTLGGEANVAFTDNPVWIFADRDEGDTRDTVLMWAGVALGLVAALIVAVVSRLLDVAWIVTRRSRT